MRKILFIVLVLSSCMKHPSGLVKTLAGEKKCWIFYSRPQEQLDSNSNVLVTGCTKFMENHTFQNYSVTRGELNIEYHVDKVDMDNSWSFNSIDSLLKVASQTFKVLRYNQDTIVLENEGKHLQYFVKMNIK